MALTTGIPQSDRTAMARDAMNLAIQSEKGVAKVFYDDAFGTSDAAKAAATGFMNLLYTARTHTRKQQAAIEVAILKANNGDINSWSRHAVITVYDVLYCLITRVGAPRPGWRIEIRRADAAAEGFEALD